VAPVDLDEVRSDHLVVALAVRRTNELVRPIDVLPVVVGAMLLVVVRVQTLVNELVPVPEKTPTTDVGEFDAITVDAAIRRRP